MWMTERKWRKSCGGDMQRKGIEEHEMKLAKEAVELNTEVLDVSYCLWQCGATLKLAQGHWTNWKGSGEVWIRTIVVVAERASYYPCNLTCFSPSLSELPLQFFDNTDSPEACISLLVVAPNQNFDGLALSVSLLCELVQQRVWRLFQVNLALEVLCFRILSVRRSSMKDP